MKNARSPCWEAAPGVHVKIEIGGGGGGENPKPKEPELKIGVGVLARDEQNTITEWVAHYKLLGFDRIIICDNMSNPSIYNTLNDANIDLLNGVEIMRSPCEMPDQKWAAEYLISSNTDLDWLLLCDADEFLDLRQEGTIKQYLQQFSDDVATIIINWVCHGTSGLQTFDTTKLAMEQFLKRENYDFWWNRFTKPFVRPNLINLKENAVVNNNIHIIHNDDYLINDAYQKTISLSTKECQSEIDHNVDRNLNDLTPLVLRHYMTLDHESMEKKRIRNCKAGWCCGNNGMSEDNMFNLDHNGNVVKDLDAPGLRYSMEWYNNFCRWGNGRKSCPGGCFKDNIFDDRMKNVYAQSIRNILY